MVDIYRCTDYSHKGCFMLKNGRKSFKFILHMSNCKRKHHPYVNEEDISGYKHKPIYSMLYGD